MMAKKKIKDIKLLDPEPEKCDHRPNAKTSTLLFLKGHITMVYPEHLYAYCGCCGKSFEYIKDEKGNLKIVEEDEE